MIEGVKHDSGKLRYDLIPPYPMAEIARVYTIGALNYDPWNWLKGIKYSRIYAAMFRHLWAWIRGEVYDPKDGQHHLASVCWGAMTLMQYERTRPQYDDRPKEILGYDDKQLCETEQMDMRCDKEPEKERRVNHIGDAVPGPLSGGAFVLTDPFPRYRGSFAGTKVRDAGADREDTASQIRKTNSGALEAPVSWLFTVRYLMAKNRTPVEIVNFELEQLEKLIRNLLIDNVNFKTGYYFMKEHTRTVEYVRGPLKEHADHILDRLKGSKEMILDYLSGCE